MSDENIQRILLDALTPTKAAELAGVDRTTIYRWINAELLPAYQDATGSTIVMRSDLEKTLQNKVVRVSLAHDEIQRTLDRLHQSEMDNPRHGRTRRG